ncbi:MAG: dihydrodiol dehydrogenase [Armatimonadota bacterium]
MSETAGYPPARPASDQAIEVVNEFATVRVRKVWTRNGERLEIASARLGHVIHLDALALESLTWQTMETFTRFLEEPYGPRERPEGVVDVTLPPRPRAQRDR